MTSLVSRVPALERISKELQSDSSIEASALYGSLARGDSESHSDIDLLIVSEASKSKLIRKIRQALDNDFPELSLSVYTKKELQFLTGVHSLFVLHLKLESMIIFDKSAYLTTLLQSFHAKVSYKTDLEDSLRLLDPLRTLVSETPNQLHRLSYVYSLFRVFGVYLLAEKGIYEFSKARMATALTELNPELEPNIAELSKLRSLNNTFFSGIRSDAQVFDDDALRLYLWTLAQMVRTPFYLRQRSYAEAVNEFLVASEDSQQALRYKMRMWFLLLVYDGINLFCKRKGLPPLTSFREEELIDRSSMINCEPARVAIEAVVCYIRSYALKYILFDKTRLNLQRAQRVLVELSNCV